MTASMRRLLRTVPAGLVSVFAVTTILAAHAQATSQLPAGMSFIAQDSGGAWGLYRVGERGAVVRLPTQQEPRHACVAPDGSKAVYSAADGTVRLIAVAANQESVLARASPQRSYTQPCMSSSGSEVYVVEMQDGKSVETEILRFSKAPEPERIARQPGAQHEPFVHQERWLVYASVGCSEGCDELLVEIWTRDLMTGKARQLTLLNALSQGPVTDGRRVIFSSNASGAHQLWQVGIDGSDARRLTDGLPQALHPAFCGGAVHFVRASAKDAVIARLEAEGRVVELPVPALNSFRGLRCLK